MANHHYIHANIGAQGDRWGVATGCSFSTSPSTSLMHFTHTGKTNTILQVGNSIK